jgi:NAD dependent epimerase/dehydratase family enzyme
MAEGRFKLVGSGDNYVSRIHVDDLATHVEAALLSDLGGAWPVADDHPCTSIEIARYCSQLLNVPMPPSVPEAGVHHTRRADRRVDGSAVRQHLGIRLRYSSYRSGISASL